MKIKKKGFTLVELLAVIAILAIILLIAVPQILGIIDSTKKDSFRNSVRGIFKAIELYIVRYPGTDLTTPHLVSELDLSNKDFVNGIWTYENGIITVKHVGTREMSSPLVTSATISTNFEVINGSYGAGEMSSALLDALDHPLKNQKCTQTSCYGFYSTDGCPKHEGTDVVSEGANTELYAIADGEITFINRDNNTCTPDFSTETICGAGCVGNVITIKHDLTLADGTTKTIYSTFRHLASFTDNLTVGKKITKGDSVGIMGTSGCSTGVHLHIELTDELGQAYNAEELLLYKGCTMNNSCPTIRAYCKY